MGASIVTVPATASAARSTTSAWGSAVGVATARGATAAGAWRRTTRTRSPPLSTSSSARSWAVARSTTCLGVHCCPAARRSVRLLAAIFLVTSEGGSAPLPKPPPERIAPAKPALEADRSWSRGHGNHFDGFLAGCRDAAQVFGGLRVDLHDVSLVEEERHLHDRPALEGGRLRAAGRRVAPDARVGLGDRELHERRQLDGHRAALDEEDVDLRVLLEEVSRVADLFGRQRDLVIGLRIHEVIAVVPVEVLHVLVLEIDQLHFLTGPERVVDDASLPHVLELGAHEGAALARLDVLEVDDGIRMTVELDLQSLLELRGGHLHVVMIPSASGSWPAAPLRDARGPGHRPGFSVSGAGRSAPLRRGAPARGRGRPCSWLRMYHPPMRVPAASRRPGVLPTPASPAAGAIPGRQRRA